MPGVTIVGLGPGDPNLLTVEARQVLADATEVHTRSPRHPALSALPPSTAVIAVEAPPADLVQELLTLGRRPQGVVYAVPGHPLVGDTVAADLLDACRRENLPCRVVAGVSLLDAACEALGIDAVAAGLQLIDPLDPRPDPGQAGSGRSPAGGAPPARPARRPPGPLPAGPCRRHRQHRLAAAATGGAAGCYGGRRFPRPRSPASTCRPCRWSATSVPSPGWRLSSTGCGRPAAAPGTAPKRTRA